MERLWIMLAGYFKKIGMSRFTVMAIGNLFLGMGISIFKLSGLGNDPFSGMVMALSDRTGITYALFLVLVNAVPVSYTHLDVYKRQIYTPLPCLPPDCHTTLPGRTLPCSSRYRALAQFCGVGSL